MTTIHTVSPRTSNARRPISPLAPEPRYDRERVVRSRRPGPARPADLRTRYRGTGVAMSAAPHSGQAAAVPLADDAGAGPGRRSHHPVAGSGRKPRAGSQRRLEQLGCCVRTRQARRRAGRTGRVSAGRGSPGGARRADPPGDRAHPRTQRPELAGVVGGPDAHRAGRLTAPPSTAKTALRQGRSVPATVGTPILWPYWPGGGAHRYARSVRRDSGTTKERSCIVRSVVIPIPG